MVYCHTQGSIMNNQQHTKLCKNVNIAITRVVDMGISGGRSLPSYKHKKVEF